MATAQKSGLRRYLPSWLQFGEQPEPATRKPTNSSLRKLLFTNELLSFFSNYKGLNSTPYKPIGSIEEQRIRESVDVIMLQVHRELEEKVEPGATDLVTIELNIRSLCTLTAPMIAQTSKHGPDKEDAYLWKIKSEKYIKALVGLAHGGRSEALICVIIEKAVAEALYFQSALKPCDITLGTHFG
ncbi:unnamed protein product [Clonostachys rosea]|uniref:Uncharacterized protein n=1 Tax=Bionectria ochroleuca TaxID=29856 RepID=A0ABY6U8T8_BIOOC|nr:unnamed protein product [Clonostachys rosea]